jgi:Zn-dependent peptidase ImmA (M78 family)
MAVTDPRAGVLRQRYQQLFADPPLPVPVERIAEDLLGLRVEHEGDLGELSGALYPHERRIVINASESLQRQRFTLGHELGHWICQCLTGASAPLFCRQQDVNGGADQLLEREANVFAAELLMPEPELRFAFGDDSDPTRLAERFGVSPLAMRWRLYGFGLLKQPPA